MKGDCVETDAKIGELSSTLLVQLHDISESFNRACKRVGHDPREISETFLVHRVPSVESAHQLDWYKVVNTLSKHGPCRRLAEVYANYFAAFQDMARSVMKVNNIGDWLDDYDDYYYADVVNDCSTAVGYLRAIAYV